MAYPNVGAIEEHADHVEPIGLIRTPVAVDPHHGRALQLLAFAMVDRLDGAAKLGSLPGFHFHKSDGPVSLNHQIDVTVSRAEAALNHAPASSPQPPFCDSFPKLSKRLPSR